MDNKRKKTKIISIVYKAAAVLLAILLWQLVSVRVGMELLLASPLEVAKRLFSLVTEADFFSTVFYTLLHITAGFLTAFFAGIILGAVSYRFKAAEILLWPYVITIRSVPVASFIILCLIWLSFDALTVFIAFLIAFPVIYSNVLSGLKATDAKMTEAARLFRVPWHRRIIYVYLPQLKPFLLSASSVAAGMAWKAGIAAEVIGVVKGSVGEKLYESKIYLLSADLFAWTLVIIIFSVIIEKLFVYALKLIFKGVVKL